MNSKVLKVLEYDKILEMLAKCSTGEKVIQRILSIKPSCDLDDVNLSLKETDEAAMLLLKYLNSPHCGLSDQESSVRRAMNGGLLSQAELISIATICRVTRQYKNYGENMWDYPIINSYLTNLVTFDVLEKEISRCIISDSEIADSASAELLTIRKSIKSLNGKIRETLNSFISSGKYSKYLQELIITIRNGRYVIPVKAEHKGDVPGLVHDTSSTGATLFIEPMAVVEANNKLREQEVNEKHEIEKILLNLSKQVGDVGEDIIENINLICNLDFAFSKGKLALEMNAVIPKINNNGIIDLKKARHPLIDKEKVVPVNIKLGRDFDTLVITGPNTGGKTVNLKTIGLLTLMAQSGLHIPAGEESEISIFDEIYGDIGDEQSIEQSLSTFSSHMTNIVNITNNAKYGSLVLFDELGAGTDPDEGAALAMSILEDLRRKGAKVVATTHYSEIKLYAMTTDRVENACCEFNVETLKPTYKLIIGIPGKSNAFAISQKLGLSSKIIENAESLLSKENIKFEDVLNELEKNRIDSMKERENAKRLENQAMEYKQLIEKEKEKLEKEKSKILEHAKEEAKNLLDKTTEEIESLLSEIQEIRKQKREQDSVRALEEIRKNLKTKSSGMEKKNAPQINKGSNINPKKLIPGTYVYITETDTNGTVVNLPDKKGNVLVQTGILKITVPVTSLRQAEQNEGENIAKKYALSKDLSGKSSSISPEIDLRGLYVQEALDKVDKFIDDAMVASLKNITIVHGKGTGALKNAIHDMLKLHPYVKGFRLGVYGEGDHGVTIVELK